MLIGMAMPAAMAKHRLREQCASSFGHICSGPSWAGTYMHARELAVNIYLELILPLFLFPLPPPIKFISAVYNLLTSGGLN